MSMGGLCCDSVNLLNVIQSLNTSKMIILKKLEGISSPFCGATDIPFWTSGDVSSGFQSQNRQPFSCLAEACVLHVS